MTLDLSPFFLLFVPSLFRCLSLLVSFSFSFVDLFRMDSEGEDPLAGDEEHEQLMEVEQAAAPAAVAAVIPDLDAGQFHCNKCNHILTGNKKNHVRRFHQEEATLTFEDHTTQRVKRRKADEEHAGQFICSKCSVYRSAWPNNMQTHALICQGPPPPVPDAVNEQNQNHILP